MYQRVRLKMIHGFFKLFTVTLDDVKDMIIIDVS